MALAPTDSVDQTVARSLGVLLKINGAPVSHTLERGFFFFPLKGSLKRLFSRTGLAYWEDLNHYHFQFRLPVIEPHIPFDG